MAEMAESVISLNVVKYIKSVVSLCSHFKGNYCVTGLGLL